MSVLGSLAGGSSGLRRAPSLFFAGLVMMLAFLASSTQAHASEIWTSEEVPLEENAEAGLNGYFSWNSYGNGGSINCGVEGAATLMPGGEGEITNFDFVNCIGTGVWNNCKIDTSFISTPWAIQAESGVISTGSVAWQWTFSGGGCLFVGPSSYVTKFNFTPDNKIAISELSLGDEIMAWTTPRGTAYVAGMGGALELSPAGVYGLQ